jgi:YD repeat-containing protein
LKQPLKVIAMKQLTENFNLKAGFLCILLLNTVLCLAQGSMEDYRFKRIDYEYDLISGNVNEVKYQEGYVDQFFHKYEYDADNRITNVKTSKDNVFWDQDAKYLYYKHGPLARTEIGENQIQGIDYAYTLQGWLKGVNSNILNPLNDIGKDGLRAGPAFKNPNRNFAKDAFGYTLNYFDGDYVPIGSNDAWTWSIATRRFEATAAPTSDLKLARNDLFNGNISSMVTSIVPPWHPSFFGTSGWIPPTFAYFTPQPLGTAYKYDQLNRLVDMHAYNNLDVAANSWQSGASDEMYRNTFKYDANGNIQKQWRKDYLENEIDSLTYRYNRDAANHYYLKTNRLLSVKDNVSASTYDDDVDNQNLSTYPEYYLYDELGNLKVDKQEEIDSIKWSVYGKIKKIVRTTGSTKNNLKFDYDASGNRIAKHVLASDNTWLYSDYYVRDAQGNTMSVYRYSVDPDLELASYTQGEKYIYGSSLLGTEITKTEMIDAPAMETENFLHLLGNKRYQLTNHLGNVLSVVNDNVLKIDDGEYNADDVLLSSTPDNIGDYHLPDVVSTSDYYPFGAPMNERTIRKVYIKGANYATDPSDIGIAMANGFTQIPNSIEDDGYRLGFNGQEKDNEISGNGNSYTATYWEYDTRLGKRWNVDPVVKPWMSPYAAFSNNPLIMVDPEGNTDFYWDSKWIGTDGKDNGLIAISNSRSVKKEIQKATKAGQNSQDYNLCSGDANAQFNVIHTDVLKASLSVMKKAVATKNDMVTEHSAVLSENATGGYDKTYENSRGTKVTDSGGNTRTSGGTTPEGDVRIHSHPIGTKTNPNSGYTDSYDAKAPTECDPFTGGDKCADADYDLNIIVGKTGTPPPAVSINGGPFIASDDNRSLDINVFGSDSQFKFTISGKAAGKVLGKPNADKKANFLIKQQGTK